MELILADLVDDRWIDDRQFWFFRRKLFIKITNIKPRCLQITHMCTHELWQHNVLKILKSKNAVIITLINKV